MQMLSVQLTFKLFGNYCEIIACQLKHMSAQHNPPKQGRRQEIIHIIMKMQSYIPAICRILTN